MQGNTRLSYGGGEKGLQLVIAYSSEKIVTKPFNKQSYQAKNSVSGALEDWV